MAPCKWCKTLTGGTNGWIPHLYMSQEEGSYCRCMGRQRFLVFNNDNNCLENTIVSHVQFYTPAHLAWQELINLFESHDDVTKIYTKDKVHTLKMKENESVAKHIQNVRAHLEQLFIVGSTIPNHLYTCNTLVEVALIMMKYCSIHWHDIGIENLSKKFFFK